jgi:hypothetical protein
MTRPVAPLRQTRNVHVVRRGRGRRILRRHVRWIVETLALLVLARRIAPGRGGRLLALATIASRAGRR